MRKKIAFGLMALVLMVTLFACKEDITLSIPDQEITIKEGDTYQIEAVTNDLSLSYKSSNEAVLTVSDTGLIEAISPGEVTVSITSNQDVEVQVILSVIVKKDVLIETDQESYTIRVGETLPVVITANDDVTCDDKNDPTFDIDNDCNIIGKAEGEGTLTITSNSNPDIFIEVTITVLKVVSIEVDKDYYELWIGKTEDIMFTSDEDVRFEVKDSTVASISDSGKITALDNGLTEVDIISTYDETVKETINVRVYNETETILISGQEKVNVDSVTTLTVEAGPDDAFKNVVWTSSDEGVATISDEGVLTALKSGTVVITATSLYDETLFDEMTIEVVHVLTVDQTKTTGDTLTYEGMDFTFGEGLFSNINDALDVATEGVTIVILAGTYAEDLVLDTLNSTLLGVEGTIIEGSIEVAAVDIVISNLNFTGNSTIMNQQAIGGFRFENNTVADVTSTNFIDLSEVYNIHINRNTFTNLSGNAITIEDYYNDEIIVFGNTITNAKNAISILAVSDYNPNTVVQIERNKIDQVVNGIEITTKTTIDIEDYVRFNEVTNYTGLAAKASVDHHVDFTLNYWGAETPVYEDFENVSTYDLRGFYSDPTDIVSELEYDKDRPVKMISSMDGMELIMGETHQVDYEILPSGFEDLSVRFITSDPEVLRISDGKLELMRSGSATITVLLSSDYSIGTKIDIIITTTPGIELMPATMGVDGLEPYVNQNILIGDVFTLDATVFPYSIKDEPVLFDSSDDSIATINSEGEVVTHSAGVVTFTATLANDATVDIDFTVEVHASLNDANIMDLLTINQVSYTMPHEWTAYGVGFNYQDFKYESVSRYYFDDLEIDQSKMVPVSSGIRPGEPMDPHPTGVTQYNPYNVYYVVVHDTANTNPGAGALSHANYLWNAAQNGTELWASWHFTMDHKALYQHLPETERGYHAGDGGSLAGTTWIDKYGNEHMGGGNRNGIGIEMGVNQDADVYRIWQRTAKHATQLLVKYDLPRDHMRYHNDFSGKDCPNTLRNAGLIPLFELFADVEYKVASEHADSTITFESHNPEYLDHTGRIINMPDRALTVSYTITTVTSGIETSRTFYTYLPGTIH